MQRIGTVLASSLDGTAALARMDHPKAKLLPLIGLPDTAASLTTQLSARNETLRLQQQLQALRDDDPDDPETRRVSQAFAESNADLKRIDALVSQCLERDIASSERPPGCWCLGVGGGGPVPENYHSGVHTGDDCWCVGSTKPPHMFRADVVRPSRILILGGLLWFERWCSCDEALRLQEERRDYQQRAIADDANALARRLEIARQAALSASGLTDKQRVYQLEAWDNRDDNPIAIELAQDMAATGMSPEGRAGLYIHGAARIGKTALAATIIKAWIERATKFESARDGLYDSLAPEGTAVFLAVPKFLREIRDSFNSSPPNTPAVTWRAYTPGLLVFDDFGAEYQTPWVRATLLEIVDYRSQRCLPTVFTSNYSVDELSNRLSLSGAEDVEVARLVGRVREMASPVQVDGVELR